MQAKRHLGGASSLRRFQGIRIVNIKWAEKVRKGLHGSADSLGNLCVEAFHYLALFGIGAITAYAAVSAFIEMIGKGGVSVDDILLLFIYLELGAMVGIYFKTNHPVTNIFSQCMIFLKPKKNHWLMA